MRRPASAARCSRRAWRSRRRSCSCWPARGGSTSCANPDVRAFLDGAGPAAIGAILGSSLILAAALSEAWQFAVLAAAAVLLLVARRGVVLTLLLAAAAGVVVALAGGPLPR